MNFGPNRRIARLQISAGLFTEFLKPGEHQGFKIVHNGLADDARVVGTYYDAGRDLVEIYLESETFEELISGNLCPLLPPPQVAALPSPGTQRPPDSIDEFLCGHCGQSGPHEVHESGHERDSSGDWRKCLKCGALWSGMTGKYKAL